MKWFFKVQKVRKSYFRVTAIKPRNNVKGEMAAPFAVRYVTHLRKPNARERLFPSKQQKKGNGFASIGVESSRVTDI